MRTPAKTTRKPQTRGVFADSYPSKSVQMQLESKIPQSQLHDSYMNYGHSGVASMKTSRRFQRKKRTNGVESECFGDWDRDFGFPGISHPKQTRPSSVLQTIKNRNKRLAPMSPRKSGPHPDTIPKFRNEHLQLAKTKGNRVSAQKVARM